MTGERGLLLLNVQADQGGFAAPAGTAACAPAARRTACPHRRVLRWFCGLMAGGLLLMLQLVLLCGRLDAAEGAPESEPVNGPVRAATKFHRNVSDTLLDASRWVDAFFSNERYVAEENRTRAQVKLSSGYAQLDGFEFNTGFGLRLKLPRMTERLMLILIRDENRDDTREEVESGLFRGEAEDADEDPVAAAVRYFVKLDDRDNLSLAAGIAGWNLFGDIRYRYLQPFGRWQWRWRSILRYKIPDGLRITAALDMEYCLRAPLFLRNTAEVDWFEDEDGVQQSLVSSLYHIAGGRSAWVWAAGAYVAAFAISWWLLGMLSADYPSFLVAMSSMLALPFGGAVYLLVPRLTNEATRLRRRTDGTVEVGPDLEIPPRPSSTIVVEELAERRDKSVRRFYDIEYRAGDESRPLWSRLEDPLKTRNVAEDLARMTRSNLEWRVDQGGSSEVETRSLEELDDTLAERIRADHVSDPPDVDAIEEFYTIESGGPATIRLRRKKQGDLRDAMLASAVLSVPMSVVVLSVGFVSDSDVDPTLMFGGPIAVFVLFTISLIAGNFVGYRMDIGPVRIETRRTLFGRRRPVGSATVETMDVESIYVEHGMGRARLALVGDEIYERAGAATSDEAARAVRRLIYHAVAETEWFRAYLEGLDADP